MLLRLLRPFVITSALLAVACDGAPVDAPPQPRLPFDASPRAVFVNFDFDGVFYSSNSSADAARLIRSQLWYTLGQLNGYASVGRVNDAQLTNVSDERVVVDPDHPGQTVRKLTYHAQIPVVWGWGGSEAFEVEVKDVPSTFILRLPRTDDFVWFVNQYYQVPDPDDPGKTRVGPCMYSPAHDVTAGDMWFWYRPDQERCVLREPMTPTASTPAVAEDPQLGIVRLKATVTPSWTQTVNKYPEYDKIWDDGLLKVVGVLGRLKPRWDTEGWPDTGPLAYADYNKKVQALLEGAVDVTVTQLGGTPERTRIVAEFADGRRFESLTMLVDSIYADNVQYYYNLETPGADLVVYSGHSGLGKNIQNIGKWGRWNRGQYTIALLNGCDSYAYVDDTLWRTRAGVNPDDPTGTKYLDAIVTAHPATAFNGSDSMLEMVQRLLDRDRPASYDTIIANMPSFAMPIVIGEADNAYAPGSGGAPEPWDGMDFDLSFKYRSLHQLRTPVLPATAPNQAYYFCIYGTDLDADLSVRVGVSPEGDLADCNPQRRGRFGSYEQCTVPVGSPAPILLNVTAATTSNAKVHLLAGGPIDVTSPPPCPTP